MRHLFDELQVVYVYLQRYIARHGHRMVQASGTLSDLYVSFVEARKLLGSDAQETSAVSVREGWPDADSATLEVRRCRKEIDARLERGYDVQTRLPLEEIRVRFDLSPLEMRLFIAALAPQVSVDVHRLYTFAWSDFAQKAPTIGFLSELVGDTADEVLEAVQCFSPDSSLVRWGLLRVQAKGPRLFNGVSVPDTLVDYVLSGKPVAYPGVAVLESVADSSLDPWLTQPLLRSVRSALRGGSPLLLLGPAGSGRTRVLSALMAGTSRMLFDVSLGAYLESQRAHDEHPLSRGIDLVRDAKLHYAYLVVHADTLLDIDDKEPEGWAAFARLLSASGIEYAILANKPTQRLFALIPDAREIVFPPLQTEVQAGCWRAALETAEISLAEPELPELLAQRFHLTPGGITTSVDLLRGQVSKRRAVSFEDVDATVRTQMEHQLSVLADPVRSTFDWSDLILDEEVLAQLKGVVTHASHAQKVFDDWGMRAKLPYGRSLSCLFTGPPGTGKTMASGVLAKSLGREIFRIDLSRISSKWVGETEKNLARLFDEAEKAQVVLLFDEADALFSTRTKVSSANDRFANMEVNFLLQRMENYDGITILTTNFGEGIDEAFKRRIRFTVHFALPEQGTRERLWRSMFPKRTPLADDVDFGALARRYELPGGNIKNAVIAAAFQAAAEGEAVAQDHLLNAADAEARKMGMLVRG